MVREAAARQTKFFGKARMLSAPPLPPFVSKVRLTATQLARSAVLNRLIAPTGLSPALTPVSRTHQYSELTPLTAHASISLADCVPLLYSLRRYMILGYKQSASGNQDERFTLSTGGY